MRRAYALVMAGLSLLLNCNSDRSSELEKRIAKLEERATRSEDATTYPTVRLILTGIKEESKNITDDKLMIMTMYDDYGDNAGLMKVELYENGKKIDEIVDSKELVELPYFRVSRTSNKKYDYFVVVTDKDGNKARSITYNVEFCSPRIPAGLSNTECKSVQ